MFLKLKQQVIWYSVCSKICSLDCNCEISNVVLKLVKIYFFHTLKIGYIHYYFMFTYSVAFISLYLQYAIILVSANCLISSQFHTVRYLIHVL